MKVCALRASSNGCPDEVRRFLAASVPVTVGTEYAVHAATSFDGVTLFQIVDDLRYPSWQPAWLFEVVDKSLPSDWLCNVLEDGSIVVGPDFVAVNDESYASMVELECSQVDKFWARIEARDSESSN